MATRHVFGAVGLGLMLLVVGCGKEEASSPAGTQPAATVDAQIEAGPVDGGGLACSTAATCPAPTSPCLVARCSGGTCSADPIDGAACSDGNPCTAGDTCQGGLCSAGPSVCPCAKDADCGTFDDGDPCTGTLRCDTGRWPPACVPTPGSAVVCSPDKNTACSENRCDPKTGQCQLTPVASGKPCSDGDPCTVESTCQGGQCVAGPVSQCQCQADADCAIYEDDDLCNGTLFCDTSLFPWACKVKPKSVVACGGSPSGACLAIACDPATGKCGEKPWGDGQVCDDGDAGTVGEHCLGGKCQGGVDVLACKSDADCEKQEDGNLCNGVLFCGPGGKCQVNPKTLITCPTVGDSACLKNLCQPLTGQCAVTGVKNGTPCDDGDKCTIGDICLQGQCQGGTSECKCQSDADCLPEDDGNLCNGLMLCNKATGTCQVNPASVVVCPSVDDTACVKNTCQPKSGKCEPQPRDKVKKACGPGQSGDECPWVLKQSGDPADGPYVCDDGKSCTVGDICEGSQCVAGADQCVCKQDADCTSQDDGDLCNGTMYCDKAANPSKCKLNPATVVTCPTVDDTACWKNLCQPKSGKCLLQPLPDFSGCDDSQACTKNDVCVQGKCQGGVFTCECQADGDCAKKDDGNLCNGTWYCDKAEATWKCAFNPGSVVFCGKGDDEACLKNQCDPKTGKCGLQPVTEGTACDDGSACTQATACKSAACVGNPKDCNDGDPCTVDTCLPTSGCQNTPKECDDGQACTLDLCQPATGQCSHDAKAMDGAGCDADGSGCTALDQCLGGQCKKGVPVDCPVPAEACKKSVCQPLGAQDHKCVVVDKADGEPCVASSGCFLDAACQTGTCKPGSAAKLYTQQRQGPKGEALTWLAVTEAAGHFWLAGRVQDGTGSAWLVDRVTLAGKSVWPQPLTLPSPVTDAQAGAVGVAAADGLTLVAGTVRSATAGRQIRLVALDDQGKTAWQNDFGQPALDEAAVALQPHAAGGYVVAGHREAGGNRDGLVLRLSPGGTALWTWTGGGTGTDEVRAVAGESDGGVLVAGGVGQPGGQGQKGWLVRLDGQGKTIWSQELGAEKDQRLEALANLPGSGWLAAGWNAEGAIRHAWWVRLSAAGKVLTQKQTVGAHAAYAVLAAPVGGGFLVAGTSDPTGQAGDGWLAAFDAQGLPVWQALFDPGGTEGLAGLRLTADGGLLAVGTSVQGGVPRGLLIRTDAWGHASCPSAGKCAGKTSIDCADTNACTDDLCDGASGCVASTTEKPCEDGDLCTIGDTCQTGKCQTGLPDGCDDGNACTQDACDPKKGCSHTPVDGKCPDGSVCTKDEVCEAGVCKATPLACDDADPCSVDSCDALKGCLHDALPDETACGGSKVCVGGKCIKKWAVEIASSGNFGGSGKDRVCVRHPDATVSCWPGGIYEYGPSKIPVLTDVEQLATAVSVQCGRRKDGTLWCWGADVRGRLGLGLCNEGQALPTPLVALADVEAVYAGSMVMCARRQDGQTWCWGDPDAGGFGDGQCHGYKSTLPCVPKPVHAPQLDEFVELFMGWFLNCGRKADGQVWCWGGAYHGNYWSCGDPYYPGNGTSKATGVPVEVTGLKSPKSVSVGYRHACAVTAEGGVVCWGNNLYGEIGDGSKTDATKPSPAFQLGSGVASVVAGYYVSCAVRVDGTVACWGLGTAGQMGDGTTYSSLVPKDVPGLTGVVEVVTAGDAVCALKKDGSVWCWGQGALGQAGYNWNGHTKPVAVSGSLAQ